MPQSRSVIASSAPHSSRFHHRDRHFRRLHHPRVLQHHHSNFSGRRQNGSLRSTAGVLHFHDGVPSQSRHQHRALLFLWCVDSVIVNHLNGSSFNHAIFLIPWVNGADIPVNHSINIVLYCLTGKISMSLQEVKMQWFTVSTIERYRWQSSIFQQPLYQIRQGTGHGDRWPSNAFATFSRVQVRWLTAR